MVKPTQARRRDVGGVLQVQASADPAEIFSNAESFSFVLTSS